MSGGDAISDLDEVVALGGAVGTPTAKEDVRQGVSAGRGVRWRRFFGQWGAVVALGWVVLLIVVAVFAPLVATHSPTAQDLTHPFAGVSGSHWLGTDDLGRDVFSRLVYGTRVSLRAAFEVVALALLFAVPIGLFAGYRGGQIDNGIMRVMDAGLSFPPLVLALAVVAVLGPGLNNTALALAVVFTPSFVRLIRGQTLAVREESFVEASRALGSRPVYVVGRRVFPNVAPPIIVQASLALGGALLAEAALSFLGLGAQPPQPSWGSMLQESYNTGLFTHPWSLVVPGLAIALAVLAFNTIGDGLTAALGASPPKRRRRHREGRKARLGLTQVNRPAGRELAGAAAPALGEGSSASRPCLVVEGLTVAVSTEAGLTPVVEEVSFTVGEGETLGLVGESGSGKTVTSLAVMRLLPSPPFEITSGHVWLGGEDLAGVDFDRMRQVRGGQVSMIFQDPMTSLNPARTVGAQLVESIRLHQRVSRPAARRQAVEMLDRVGIADPGSRAKSFPHQLSGGMRQRVMIAMALSSHPRLLIADEPTTALDVTVQAQILDLLAELSRSEQLAVVFVTHDLGVVAEICDRVAVMYAGQIVEVAATAEIYRCPRHPYTEGLIAASRATAGGVTPIPGDVPSVGHFPTGCRFHPRCPYAIPHCAQAAPAMTSRSGVLADANPPSPVSHDPGDHECRCWRQSELTLKGMV